MPVSAELMEIVGILNQEGFTELGGELLIEVARGIEIDADLSPAEEGSSPARASTGPKEKPRVRLSEDLEVIQRYFDLNEGRGDPPPVYQPIPKAEQLAFAAGFLKLRLIEPMRRLAEAEVLAGALAAETIDPASERSSRPKEEASRSATRVTFTAEGEAGETLARRQAQAGSTEDLDAFAELLGRIAAEQR